MNRHRAALCALLLSPAAAQCHAEIYQWKDAQGRTHFGDRKPASVQATTVTQNINTYSSPEILPARTIAKPAAAGVVMYSASWCGVCKQASAYFAQNQIPFTEYDIETSEQGRADFEAMAGRGVPIILVNDRRMNGFSPDQFEMLYRWQK